MDFFKAIQYVLHYSEQQKVMICVGKKGCNKHAGRKKLKKINECVGWNTVWLNSLRPRAKSTT